MRGLLQPPQILTQPSHCGRRVEHNLRPVQAQGACAFGEVSVIADVHTDLRETQIKNWIAKITGPKVELLPKAGRNVRNMGLPIFAEVSSVVMNHRSCVIEDA